MNTPEPCCYCKNLYWNVLEEENPDYIAECKLGLLLGIQECNLLHYVASNLTTIEDRYLQAVRVPETNSELYCWKIVDQSDNVPIGFIYVGPEGMAVDWIAFADGYVWPKVNNIISAINAVQKYLDKRWENGTLEKRAYIN